MKSIRPFTSEEIIEELQRKLEKCQKKVERLKKKLKEVREFEAQFQMKKLFRLLEQSVKEKGE